MWCPKYGCAVALAACIADPATAQVFGEGPSARFEALFESGREPIFTRPEVSALFPGAELVARDEGTLEEQPTTTAQAAPPATGDAGHAASAPAAVVAGAETAKKLIKELVISPAESAPSPPPAPDEVAAARADPPPALVTVTPTDPPPAPVAAAPADPPPAPVTVTPSDPSPALVAVAPAAQEPAQATGTIARALPPTRAAAADPAARDKIGRRIAVTRAAWYQHAGRTASGEKYNPDGLTAAHRTLPLGTKVRVVNQRNGRSVVVRINDRVPKTAKQPVDLSRGSARAIGLTGIAPVALYEVK
jgi:rare lipoprotein A